MGVRVLYNESSALITKMAFPLLLFLEKIKCNGCLNNTICDRNGMEIIEMPFS